MNSLLSLIGQLGIFLLCAQAILHFRPKKVYEKYLRLLLGLMILLQVIRPLYGFFHRDESSEWQVSLEYFQEKLDESMAEAAKQAAASEGLLEQMSLEEVQKRLEAETVQEQMEETGTREGPGWMETTSLEEGQRQMEKTESGEVLETEAGSVEDKKIEIEQVRVELGDADLSKKNADEGAFGEAKQSEVEP